MAVNYDFKKADILIIQKFKYEIIIYMIHKNYTNVLLWSLIIRDSFKNKPPW